MQFNLEVGFLKTKDQSISKKKKKKKAILSVCPADLLKNSVVCSFLCLLAMLKPTENARVFR